MANPWAGYSHGGSGYVGSPAAPAPAAPPNSYGVVTGQAPGMVAGAPGAAAPKPQTPGPFGTGTYIPPAFPINYGAITGNPAQTAGGNYGLNDIYSQLQNATNNLTVRNYAATAPTATAPTGTAAQGSASSYTAPQGYSSGYNAAYGTGSAYDASQGSASSTGQVAGAASLGNASYADPTRISTAGDLAWQAQQQGLANILANQAAGGGMSPADLQLQSGEEQSLANQLAALGSQRGSSNFALAQRSAADQAAATQQNTNYQAALLRANETLQAQQALGSVLGTARGQAQNYNINQAGLTQGLNEYNASNLQGMTLADMSALNAQTQQNVALAQQSNQFNAGQAQNMTLADMLARNQALQYNAGNSQQAMLANQGAQNAALQYNAGNSQQMALANLLQQANALQYNAGNAQGMTLANLGAQNQFGMANLENAQQTGLANLNLAGQYGISNQAAAIQAQNQYYNQLNALLGAQTGIGQANRSAALAGQQLGVQQNTALDQIAAEAYASSAQANANLTGGVIGAVGTTAAGFINKFTGQPTSASDPNAVPNPASTAPVSPTDVTATGPGMFAPSTPDTSTPPDYSLSSPYGGPPIAFPAPNPTFVSNSPAYQLSDENLKTGIEGGNPMLQSFLRQYQEARGENEATINPDSGLAFHVQRYAKAMSGGSSGSSATGGVLGGIGSLIPIPGVGSFLSGLGTAIDDSQSSGGSAPKSVSQMTSPASGLQQIGVTDEDSNALEQQVSDENEKEAVTSGNRGLQAFLEQANAQTNAQNSQGAYNNAFMQTGGPPQPQVNTQMPPNPNAGYGQPSLQQLLSSGYGGGGLPVLGGYQSGGWQGGGMTAPGSYSPAAMAGLGSEYGAGIANPGSYSAGGITQGPTLRAGTLSGGVSPSTPAPAPLTVPMPNLATRPVGASSVTAPINQPLTGVIKAPLNPSGYTPQPAASSAYGGIVPLNPNTGGGYPVSPISNTTLYTANSPGVRLSDEQAKTDVSESPQEMHDFLDALHAHSYRYKNPSDPGAGHGRYVSPMAQELQRSELGRSFVVKRGDGRLMVDYGKMAGTQLAATAMMNERVNKLEKLLAGPR